MLSLGTSHEYRRCGLKLVTFPLIATLILGFSLGTTVSVANASEQKTRAPLLSSTAPASAALEPSAAWLDLAMASLMGDEADGVLLSEKDVKAYQDAFAAQEHAAWAKADAALAKVHDRSLVGHLLLQRYLHPKSYKASYDELKHWLASYADLPGARRVYMLAVKRQATLQGKAARLAEPVVGTQISGSLTEAAVSRTARTQAWEEGLDAWKAKDYGPALKRFESLARNEKAGPWERSAGAFWAARALTRLGQPEQVSAMLSIAARFSRTFYGQLAARQLGRDAKMNWQTPPLAKEHLLTLSETPAGKRALALLQIGQVALAEAELRGLNPQGDDAMEEALLVVASNAGLTRLAYSVGMLTTAPSGALYDAALYPVPRWQPENGYQVHRALIYALIRQESRFDPRARSQAGALGLMQLMPTTASYVSGEEFDDDNMHVLEDPETNISIGQKYVSYLLKRPELDRNLVYLLAAYNGGPSLAAKWKREIKSSDPLLFLESLPVAETRDFVQRVLANYWIYLDQMNMPAPSLDALAKGKWPKYVPEPVETVTMATPISLN